MIFTKLKKIIVATGIAGICSVSCASIEKTVVSPTDKKIFNQKYGSEKRNVMDIFLPKTKTEKVPLVIIIHGGVWVFGKKEHIWNIRNYLLKNNIPNASINYRLVNNTTTYKAQLEDVGNAIKFAKANAKSWNLESDDIILLGESAGAHLALLYAYHHPEEVKKVISMSGPTDFYSEGYLKSKYYKRSHLVFQKVVGGRYRNPADAEKFREASPLAIATTVPTLLFQGDRDFLVNKAQGKALDSVLTERNVPHSFIELKGAGHAPRLLNRKIRDGVEFPEILKFIKD